MWAVAPAVGEDVVLVAPRVHQGGGQQGRPVERPLVVDTGGQPQGVGRPPAGGGRPAQSLPATVTTRFRFGPFPTATRATTSFDPVSMTATASPTRSLT